MSVSSVPHERGGPLLTQTVPGNLSWNTNDDTLRNVFSQYGNVLDSIVMRDRETGRSRGFGFVTYATQDEATGAIATANGIDLDGRQIKVNLANARGSGGAGGPGGPGAMYPPQPGFGGGYPGFPGSGYGGGGGKFPSMLSSIWANDGAAPYGGAGFGGYQPPQGNAGFGGFNQGPAGYGAPPNQFPPNQGGYPGQY
ncbi:RNA-binding protein [Rhizoctonia solani]|uniref:RNA-binding protein n=1 Tax=Rhizoctonia solani TaxID=456999 RepID=A0A8H7HCM1_9AGAM|nr:RNA-binding protein [Rhizoctonia solani]